jgi:hypothetical protein
MRKVRPGSPVLPVAPRFTVRFVSPSFFWRRGYVMRSGSTGVAATSRPAGYTACMRAYVPTYKLLLLLVTLPA